MTLPKPAIMNTPERSIFILAEPGPFRDALTALVASLPAGTGIYLEDMAGPALARLSTLRPTVLLLDDDLLADGLPKFMASLHEKTPDTLVLLLASTIQREQEGARAGVAVSLVKGTPVQRLIAVLEGLLDEAGRE